MFTREDLTRTLKECNYLKSLFLQILIKPQTITNKSFAYTKNRTKYNNKFVWIFILVFLFSYTLIKIFTGEDNLISIITTIFSCLLSIIAMILPILEISFDVKIKKEYRLYYILSFIAVGLVLNTIITILDLLFIKTELYIFYALSIAVAFIRLFWLCFYIPFIIKKDKFIYKLLRLLKILITFIFTNFVLTMLMVFSFSKQYKNVRDYEFILLNDPIFTETYNEIKYITKYDTTIRELFIFIADYDLKDIQSNENIRNLIVQKCQIVLNELNEETERYNSLTFKKTKELYLYSEESIKTIKRMVDTVSNIQSVDMEELDNKLKETRGEINSIQQELNNKKERLNILIESIKEKNEEKQNIEKNFKTNEEIINGFISENYTYLINELFDLEIEAAQITEFVQENNKKYEQIKKEMENITYEIQKAQNNLIELKRINYLIKKETNELYEQNIKLEKISKYLSIRIKFLYFGF